MSYQSHADLGGLLGYGPVIPEPEGEIFHADWEPRALALTLAMGAAGAWNIDKTRSARETLPDYSALSYYAIWTRGLERLLLEHAFVTPEELAAARSLTETRAPPKRLQAADVAAVLAHGAPTLRPADVPARFAVGDLVRTRQEAVPHHTRLPAYARGKLGRIDRVLGMHVYADCHAQGLGEQPQWLYTVVFSGRELWGDVDGKGLSVSIDAWEPYLAPGT
jgi:nitrile hydratase subunit beta